MADMAGKTVELLARSTMIPNFSSVEDALAFLVQTAEHITGSKYTTFAFFTLLIYDHILTLPEEVNIVWLGRPSFVKALFLFNRYFVPIFLAIDIATLTGAIHITDKFCRGWLSADAVLEVLSLVSTTLIITYRIHAVLGNIYGMLPILLGIWGGQAAVSMILVIAQLIVKGSKTAEAEPFFKICIVDVKSVDAWTVWIPSMAFHTLVFGLLVWKIISTPRDTQTPMLMVLIRDGILYFGVVFAAFLFNLVIWAVSPVTLAILPHDSVWCITTMALSRLMLSMDNISSKVNSTEEDDTLPAHVTRPMSTATIPLEFRRNFEKKIASLRGVPIKDSQSRPQTPISIVETVNMEEDSTSAMEQGSRSGSVTSMRGDIGRQVRAEDAQAWFPGAISEDLERQNGDLSVPTSSVIRESTPSPMPYIRPLPPIPVQATKRAQSPAEKWTSTFSNPFRSRRRSESPHSPTEVGPSKRKSHKSSASIEVSVPRGSTSSNPPNVHEMRPLPQRPSIAAYGSGDSAWTETPWPAYATRPSSTVVDRKGSLRQSNSGGVDL